ncbi:tetratricopeptide repeat protein [Tepidibacillus infernus]|uniref:tetratricopeptide repeat protein n=1 Tax=Tepidibacillus infernus TaxID=1806172 RepID=UPI003B71061E
MIHHELFAHMTQTLDRLGKEFEVTNSIDEELSLLEKYLSIKEMSEEITGELKKLNEKIRQFEKDHGLLDMDLHVMKDTDTMTEKYSEVVIKLDEEDFITFQKGIGFFDLWMYDQAILHLETTTKKYPDFNLARLYTAMTYFKKKEYAYSKREILILFKYSDDPDLLSLGHNLLGMIYGLERDEEQAIYHFKKAIELKKNWTEPIFNLAMLYYQTKHYHESISYLKELAQINTNDWEVLFYLGKAYQKLGEYDQAIEWLKKTYTIAKQPMIVRQIAVNFEKRLHFEQATQWYKKWLELEPFQSEALLGLAKNEWLKGNKETGMVLLFRL